MKKIIFTFLAFGLALSVRAESLSFIKIGGRYQTGFGNMSVPFVVKGDAGNGWYFCQLTVDGTFVFLNLNVVGRITPLDGPMAEANERSPESIRIKVTNNLRQLCAAADQFYLENGVEHVTLAQLVGPDKYVKVLNPVDGEDYNTLVFRQGQPLAVTTKSGITVRYAP